MILLEYDDYMEVYDSMQLINEGLLGKLREKLKLGILSAFGKNYVKQVNTLIASKEINSLIDDKKGTLIYDAVSEADMADPTVPVKDIIAKFKGVVKMGQLFHNTLDSLAEEMEIQDEILKMKLAIEELDKQGGRKEEVNVKTKELEGLTERGNKLKTSFAAKRKQLEENINSKIAELKTKVSNKGKLPLFEADISRRINLAKTAATLIEFELRKKRFSMEDLGTLQKDMVETYKKSLQSAKDLEQQISDVKGDVADKSATFDAKQELQDKYKIGADLPIQSRPDKDKIDITILEYNDDKVLVGIKDGDTITSRKSFTYDKLKQFIDIAKGVAPVLP